MIGALGEIEFLARISPKQLMLCAIDINQKSPSLSSS